MILPLTYKPEALFRIRPVTRASSTLEGHTEAVLSVQFSADGASLASASGDTTVRIWDLFTETPMYTCGGVGSGSSSTGHKDWVLCLAFSPDCSKLASGGKDSMVFIWDAQTGK